MNLVFANMIKPINKLIIINFLSLNLGPFAAASDLIATFSLLATTIQARLHCPSVKTGLSFLLLRGWTGFFYPFLHSSPAQIYVFLTPFCPSLRPSLHMFPLLAYCTFSLWLFLQKWKSSTGKATMQALPWLITQTVAKPHTPPKHWRLDRQQSKL